MHKIADNLLEELVHPFIKATREIIFQASHTEVKETQPFIRDTIDLQNTVVFMTGLTGSIKGQVMISFSEEIARSLASDILGGAPVAILDQLSQNALLELSNMIIGNAIPGLYNNGATIDLAISGILLGREISYHVDNGRIITIPFEVDDSMAIELYLIIND